MEEEVPAVCCQQAARYYTNFHNLAVKCSSYNNAELIIRSGGLTPSHTKH